MEITINSLDELEKSVQLLLQQLENRRVLAFTGEIGAGKTTFIQAFCRHFGVREPVTSPTYALVNEYTYQDGQGQMQYIYHMDLYRLKQMEEALDFGIEEYLYDDHYCLVEWPEIVEELLPEDTVWINLQIVNDSTRKMLIL